MFTMEILPENRMGNMDGIMLVEGYMDGIYFLLSFFNHSGKPYHVITGTIHIETAFRTADIVLGVND